MGDGAPLGPPDERHRTPYAFPILTQTGTAIEPATFKRSAPELESRIQRLEACLHNIELTPQQD